MPHPRAGRALQAELESWRYPTAPEVGVLAEAGSWEFLFVWGNVIAIHRWECYGAR